MWLEMGNSMIDKDFEFQTWHAIWSLRLHIFLLSTSWSSRCLVFERILWNYHNHHDECDQKLGIRWYIWIIYFKRDMLCEVQGSISSFFWLQCPPDVLYLKNIHKSSLPQWLIWWEMGNRMIDMDFEFQTWHAMWNSRLQPLPSFDFRVLQMICIWQNIIKLSLSSWWMWLEMGNRMIDKDFEFQTWHAM